MYKFPHTAVGEKVHLKMKKCLTEVIKPYLLLSYVWLVASIRQQAVNFMYGRLSVIRTPLLSDN